MRRFLCYIFSLIPLEIAITHAVQNRWEGINKAIPVGIVILICWGFFLMLDGWTRQLLPKQAV